MKDNVYIQVGQYYGSGLFPARVMAITEGFVMYQRGQLQPQVDTIEKFILKLGL